MRTIFLVMGGWLLLSFGLAAVFMKWEWNYFLGRPPVFQAVSQMKRVQAVGYFDHGWYADVTGLKEALEAQLTGDELYDDPYYYLNVRPLMAARDAGIDAIAAPEMSAKQVDAVVREFLHRGLTVNS